MTKKVTDFLTRPIVLLLLGAFFVRILLSSVGTLSLDQNTFIAWAHMVNSNGASSFYSSWSDYLPGFIYVLWILAKLESVVPISAVVLYKLPAIIGDVAAGYIVYSIVKKLKGEKTALISSAVMLFNPAFLANSTFWGQVDILTALFSVLAIMTLKKNWLLSAVFLAVGAMIKPQAALAAPVILLLMINNRAKVKDVLLYVLTSLAVFLAGFVPFANGANIFLFVIDRLNVTLGQYQYTSINAFNFWGLWGFWQKESVGILSEKNVGLVLFTVTGFATYWKIRKEKTHEYLLLGVLLLANFLFFTRMHERHLLPAILPLSIAAALNPVLFIPVAVLSLTYILNINYSFVWITENFKEIFSHQLIAIFIILNLLSLFFVLGKEKIALLVSKVKGLVMSRNSSKELTTYVLSFWKQKKDPALTDSISKRSANIIIVLILAFAFLTRVISLGSPDHEYFDEVYHAFTARAMLHGDVRAWEWWNENPPGFAFEWTHPPFAKEAMVAGMLVFGESSFGWRIPAALFGTGAVFLIYLIGRELFSREVGLLSAAVFSLDGLALVMSRIGMNDIYLVFFMLLSFYLFVKNRYLFSSIALGFALSSKWTTFWFVPVIIASAVLLKKKLRANILWFVLLPPLIYVGTYTPMFLSGHSWEIFWGMQKQMWWYHTRLVATHPYTSPWWSWPFLLRPIWLYTSGVNDGYISNIYAMGNPVIFWGGFISVLTSVYYAFVERRKNLLLIIIAYGGVFVPWALSPRIMFLYHYFPAIPFLAIATGFVLSKNKKFVAPFLLLSLAAFIYFYPQWTGIPVPTWLSNSYFWLPSWR